MLRATIVLRPLYAPPLYCHTPSPMIDDCIPPRDTSPHQDSTGTAPSGTAAHNTADTGNTVPQRANPTQTAYAHPRRRTQAQGQPHPYSLLYCHTPSPHPYSPPPLYCHTPMFGLYKIFFYFESFVHESTMLSFPLPTCIAHPGAMPLARLLGSLRAPSDLPLYTIHYW